jgi:hypothetical protein
VFTVRRLSGVFCGIDWWCVLGFSRATHAILGTSIVGQDIVVAVLERRIFVFIVPLMYVVFQTYITVLCVSQDFE